MDDLLRKHFDTLRDEETDSNPGYEQVLERPRPPSAASARWNGFGIAIPALAFTAALLWFILPAPRVSEIALEGASGLPAAFEVSPARWSMPTDVLLVTPGVEFLRDLPALGTDALLPEPLVGADAQWSTPG